MDAGGDGDLPTNVADERRTLLGLAYRMTGTLTDAEDVVQETYVRWYRLDPAERAAIRNPAAWLTRVASRVALDNLGSARARRERYVGQWLPEPVPADLFAGTGDLGVGSPHADGVDPLDRVTLDDAVSAALLVVLEAMTPAERVAFVLHDVFGMPFAEIAEIVGRSVEATRQLAASARRHVRDERAIVVSRTEHDRAVRAFAAASSSGDLAQLMAALSPDVELRSDGGGIVNAARNAVLGPDRVARFLLGIAAKEPTLRLIETRLGDGALGFRMEAHGRLLGMASFTVRDGAVGAIQLMLNPHKLTRWV